MKNIFLLFAVTQTIFAQELFDREYCPGQELGPSAQFLEWCSFPVIEHLAISVYPQENGWEYAIWEDLMGVYIFVRSPSGVWWTETEGNNDCFSERGDLDKIRMELDYLIKNLDTDKSVKEECLWIKNINRI